MKQWTVMVGKREIQINDNGEDTDAVEICTRALEYLNENGLDYAVGPLIEARCGDVVIHQRGAVVLANAGRYFEAAELERQIKKHLEGGETNAT